ncbi:MAG: cache domain-containing protein [Prolixibacteraceae bacterium]|jgi:hypothetical protein
MSALTQSDPKRKNKNTVFRILLLLSVISLVAAATSIWHHIQFQRNCYAKTKTELQSLTVKATQDIETIFRQAMANVDSISNKLSAGEIDKSEIQSQIRSMILKNPDYYGSTICYRPYGYNSSSRLFAPYYHRINGDSGELEFVQLEKQYDYTQPEFDWYVLPMKEGSRWGEPYWDPAGKTYMITYSSVFYDHDPKTGKRNPLGVVTLDISMDYIRKIIENIDLGASGFGALVSSKGVYLYHPNSDYVISKKTITQVGLEKNDQGRFVMAEMAAKGESGFIDHISTTTQEEAWLVFAPVPLTGWSLQNTFLKKDIVIDVDTYRHNLIRIVVLLLTFILLLLASIYSIKSNNKAYQWALIFSGSLVLIVAIGSIWSIALAYNPADKIAGIRISDKATLQNILEDYKTRSKQFHLEPPLFVPTGVYIDAIRFSGSSDVFLSGYIWQKYSKDFPEDIAKEFMISKATNVSIQKINSSVQDGNEIIQFHFDAEIRQKLTHKTYPLEVEVIELQIIHKDLGHNIVLTPDLDAYKVRSASQLPGLDKAAFISGWNMINSYYEIRRSDLNSNFGIVRTVDKGDYPILYYNIEIQRNFIDAFISNLTPLIIVSVMLFFMLFLMDKIDTAKVFSTCIAMFFVIVFSHIDIRGKISAQEIFYLEYFYFITYGLILYVAINAIGWLMQRDVWIYRYKSSIYGLLYWPILLGLTFVVTVTTFY